jgi:hypothetical protein
LHGFCLSIIPMSNMETYRGNTFEVMHLLEDILDGFQDEYCRPANQIALYDKYLELRQTHDAKMVRHLIVITGGRPAKPAPANYSAPNVKRSKKANAARPEATSGRRL